MQITALKDNDYVTGVLFGKEKKLQVVSVGSNSRDKNGRREADGFLLDEAEISMLNWIINEVKIEDYKTEIIKYCNYIYDLVGEKNVTEEDIEKEISINSIFLRLGKTAQSKDGFVYPEISFYGGCRCDPEHGICIGFRDKKFIGVESQDWTL